MTTRTPAQGTNMPGIDPVLAGVCPQEANRSLYVVDGSGELIAGRQPVVCGGRHIPVFCQFHRQ